MTNNRNPTKQFFYTFPQTDETKHTFRESLQKIHPMKYYKIVQETHEDGNKHLHAVVVLTKAIAKSKILKQLKTLYPNSNKRIDVQSIRSIKNAIAYLSKEDTCPLESAEKFTDARNPRNAFINRMVRNWGFPNVKSFKSYMEQHRLKQNAEQDKLLERIAKLESLIIKMPQIVDEPEVKMLLFIRDKYLRCQTVGMSISKDDMTKFHENYNSSVELL